MARTLGSEEADQVTKPGRRVLIGWTGPANSAALHNQGSAQSLPRELTLAKDKSLLQRFVPELQTLRKDHSHAAAAGKQLAGTQACEVSASFPASCGAKGSTCGVSVLGKAGKAAVIVLDVAKGLVTVDATALGNPDVRAGPLPAADADGGWTARQPQHHSGPFPARIPQRHLTPHMTPHTPCATMLYFRTWCMCWPGDDWCLESDVVADLGHPMTWLIRV